MNWKKITPLLFLLPALAFLGFLQYFAWGWNVNILLHDVSLTNFLREWPWAGLSNFGEVLSDPVTWTSLKNTAIFASSSIALQMIIGLGIAYLLFRASRDRERLIRPVVILPWLCSVVIAAFSWQLMFAQDAGMINNILTLFGIEQISFLTEYPMLAIIIANTWWGTPFTILFMGSGLASISPRMLEAAKIDGASEWSVFKNIALPLLLPFLIMNLILISVWTINMFGLILILTEGGPVYATRVFPLHGYLLAFDAGNFSAGAVIAFLSVMINLVLVYAYVKVSDVELF